MKLLFTTVISILLLHVFSGEFIILSVTDTHGHVNKLRVIATLVAKERLKHSHNSILVDAGDTLQGTIYATDYAGVPMQIANQMNIDIWVPGNHDFEITPFQFNKFKGITLGANWLTPNFNPKAWTLVQHKNLKVAFIGLTEHNLKYRYNLNIDLIEPAVALKSIIAEVRKAKPNLIVLICHDGLFFRGGSLKNLIAKYPEIKLVIGGHSHQEIAGQFINKNSWFVQAGKHAEALAKITVAFDDNSGKVKSIKSHLIKPDKSTIPATFSPQTEADIARIDHEKKRIITTFLNPISFNGEVFYNDVYADLLGRAMEQATQSACAIYVGNAFTKTISSGPFTYEDLFNLYPFEEILCSVELTPNELKTLLIKEGKLLRSGHNSILVRNIHIELDKSRGLTALTLPKPNANGLIKTAFTTYYLVGSGGRSIFMRKYIPRTVTSGVYMREAILSQLQAGESQQSK